MAAPPPGNVPVKVSADIMRLGISNLQQKSRGASRASPTIGSWGRHKVWAFLEPGRALLSHLHPGLQ